MPHKLLIEFDIDFDSTLKRHLQPREVIRSEPIKLVFFVTNCGAKQFPGGTIRNWRILCGPQHDIETTSATANVECKRIAAGDRVMLMSEEYVPIVEGLTWIRFAIEPKGKDKVVQYYQSREEVVAGHPFMGGEWCNFFYVVNREILVLTSAMEELAKSSRQKEEAK